jgi:hypothetical protein
VAVPLYTIRDEKGESGDFFRAVTKQRPDQYQGIYIVSPEGKVLASQAREPAKRETWARAIVDVIEDGVRAYGPISARKVPPLEFLPDRGVGRRKDGSIVLAVYTRTMHVGVDKRGFGDATLDSVVLADEDRGRLEFPDLAVGDDLPILKSVAKKLYPVLSPNSDCNTLPKADEVDGVKLSARVERVQGNVAYLHFQGRIGGVHTWPFPPHKGKKISAEVILAGIGSCDRKTGKILSLLLLGDGRYRNYPPYDNVVHYGAVVEWRLER